jgi:hypothetical protein
LPTSDPGPFMPRTLTKRGKEIDYAAKTSSANSRTSLSVRSRTPSAKQRKGMG